MALMRKPQYRKFSYEPRYYKPELDNDERRRRKMQFHRRRAIHKSARRVLYWAILFIFLIYLYASLAGWFR